MAHKSAIPEQKLLWNPENVKDVAESVGIASLVPDAIRCLSQDIEYRIGQILIEGLRFMRAANRMTLTVLDISQALRMLDVEPLYGYDSTRPLRYGEATLGPGQPLFYVDDEEVDFEKLINAPLPKVPRDTSFTAHWLAIEGVQPAIPQNPTVAETSTKDVLHKGAGANPALAALAGNDNIAVRPAIKHVISKELILYFDRIQAALLDDDPDDEKMRLRGAALGSVRSDPGLHQLLPYFVSLITNQVSHRLDDIFVLRQMMYLTEAVISNPYLFLDPYVNSFFAPVLTCLLGRHLGTPLANGNSAGASGTTTTSGPGVAAPSTSTSTPTPTATMAEKYALREQAAALLGAITRKYSRGNALLRPKLTRTCLKCFLDPTRTAAQLYGAISGLAAAGGAEAIRVLVLPNLKTFDTYLLTPLKEKTPAVEYEALVSAVVKAVMLIAPGEGERTLANGVTAGSGRDCGPEAAENEAKEIVEFLGEKIGWPIVGLRNKELNKQVLDARQFT